jgi:8-oxo-dGTP diphosphatase
MPGNYYKFVAAVHLFLIKDGKILLLRRKNTGYEDGNYSVPAGHIEANEPATVAMTRESQEETGIIIKPEALEAVHIMHRKADDQERIDFFFTTKTWVGEPTITEPDKCDDLSWFNLDNLPENIIPYIKTALENYKKGLIYSEFGW